MKTIRILPLILCLGGLALGACTLDEADRGAGAPTPGESQRPLEMDLTLQAPFAPPSDQAWKDSFFTYVGKNEPPMLPKWKTTWERAIERVSQNAKASGQPYADSYDTYRQSNITSFFITKPPTSTSFYTPGEYEQSQAYVLYWINSTSYQSGNWKTLFMNIIKGAWGVVPVLLPYDNAAHKTFLQGVLTTDLKYTAAEIATNAIFWKHSGDSIWSRDYGPVSIVETGTTGNEKISFIDYRYYHTRVHDDELPSELASDWGVNVYRPDLDFEGGNFDVTSDGLCAATKGVLWYNLNFSQSAVEKIFADYQNCKKSIFPAPMTGGVIAHIDMFSKIAADDKMLVGEYTATQSASNKAILDAYAVTLAAMKTPSGKTITVVRIPMPDIGKSGTTSIWRTYTNAVALNGGTKKVVLVPTYSDETTNEAKALTAYGTAFPGWTIVKVDSKIVIPGQGAVHCITMQIPAGKKAKMETDPAALCGATKFACAYTGCGNITSKGCCEGQLLKYCNGGKLAAMDCTSDPKCGWDSTSSWYDCGTSGTADPSKKYVMNCGVLTDAPLPDMGPDLVPSGCGKVTTAGCCDGETVWYCESGTLKMIPCAAKGNPKCGWDTKNSWYDCGTTGGADPSGKAPKSCAGFFGDGGAPPTDGLKFPDAAAKKDTGGSTGCGSITSTGCCDGETLKYCASGKVTTTSCSGNPKCGWSTSSGWYDCGTSGGADPSGKYAKACSPTSTDGGADKGSKTDKSTAPDTSSTTPDTGSTQKDTSTTQKDTSTAKADTSSGGGDGGGGCNLPGRSPSDAPVLPVMMMLAALGLVLRRRW